MTVSDDDCHAHSIEDFVKVILLTIVYTVCGLRDYEVATADCVPVALCCIRATGLLP